MGKLVYSMFVLFMIQAAAILFLGVSFPGTALYSTVTGAEAWNAIPLIDYVSAALLAIGAIGIVIGLYVVRNDFIFYASIGAVLLSFGQAYYEMYQKIYGAMGGYIPQQIIVLFFVPVILPWIFLILDWIRGRD
jgi:hypothetical protein